MPVQIKDIPLFQGLSGPELKQASSCLVEKNFKKGESLFLEGNACERVFIVREGRVKIYRTSSAGREQILETLGLGDTCACNPGVSKWNCSSSATALTPCLVWFLSRENYVRLVQTNQKVSQALAKLFAERLQCFGSLIEEVSLKDSKKRLVKFLLDMRSGSGELPLTREEIAQRIGTARETVARYLSQLKRAHLIGIESRRIVILDEPGLKKLIV